MANRLLEFNQIGWHMDRARFRTFGKNGIRLLTGTSTKQKVTTYTETKTFVLNLLLIHQICCIIGHTTNQQAKIFLTLFVQQKNVVFATKPDEKLNQQHFVIHTFLNTLGK